jgi:hypothetical protein
MSGLFLNVGLLLLGLVVWAVVSWVVLRLLYLRLERKHGKGWNEKFGDDERNVVACSIVFLFAFAAVPVCFLMWLLSLYLPQVVRP